MPVPETAIYKDYYSKLSQHEIWAAGQIRSLLVKRNPLCLEPCGERLLRRGVSAPNSLHDSASGCGVKRIGHAPALAAVSGILSPFANSVGASSHVQ